MQNKTKVLSILSQNPNHIPLNSVSAKQFIYMKRYGKQYSENSKSVSEELVNDTRSYLVEHHSETLIGSFGNREKKKQLASIISNYIATQSKHMMKGYKLEETTKELVFAIAGLGKFDKILESSPDITDISFDGKNTWIKEVKKKKRRYTEDKITSEEVEVIAKKVAFATNQTWNYATPELDAELPRLRINAMDPSIAHAGVTFSLRQSFDVLRIDDESIVTSGMATPTMLAFLIALIQAKINIVITGETGAGKTELMKYLLGKTDDLDRINLLEDTAETELKKLYPLKDIMMWRTRKNEDETKSIDFSRLSRSSLRNDVDWLVITETRGKESLFLIEAGQTGHRVITTLHSPPRKAISRLITMCKKGQNLDDDTLERMITDVFQIGVHVEQNPDTMEREIVELVEYRRIDDRQTKVVPIITLQSLGTEKVQKDGKTFYKARQEHAYGEPISEELADKLLKYGVISEELIPILPKSWATKHGIGEGESI